MGGHLHFHSLLLRLVNSGYGRDSTIYWILIENIYSLLENFVPVMQGIATLLEL